MFRNNPAYQQAAQEGKYSLYIPENIMSYHTSRFIQAANQQIYSNAGATKEVLEQVMTEIIERCNNQKDIATMRTDIAAFANSVKYRLKYPVDELCSLRMGAILCYLEYENEDGTVVSEDPDKYDNFWTKKKMDLAMDSPNLYSFFLTWGISNTPQYREHSGISIDMDYFMQRRQMLESLLPGTSL